MVTAAPDAARAAPTAGALPFPESRAMARVSTTAEIDVALAALHAAKATWLQTDAGGRAALLAEMYEQLGRQREAWIDASLAAKGVAPGGFADGEERTIFGGLLRLLRMLRQAILNAAHAGHPRLPAAPFFRANDQVVVPVFPAARLEGMLLQGMRAETWLEPGVTLDAMFLLPQSLRRARQNAGAGGSEGQTETGRVALVLGAGNVGVLPCADLLHKLFLEDQVVALKMNPVNAYLGPILEQGFRALIERGFLRILYGGAEVGAYLCDHPLVDTIHLTGSDKTYESVVFGLGEEGRQRKAARNPRTAKPVTAELGCINPVIVVPGAWSEQDLKRGAAMLATWLYSNAAFSCLTPRLIFQHRQWPQRQQFLDALGDALAETPLRAAYYPGAPARHAAFGAAHPEARLYGVRPDSRESDEASDMLPWMLIADVDAGNLDDICFRSEAFCGVLSETALDAESAAEFLAAATAFANDHVWGTLTATLLVPDGVTADKQMAPALDRTLAELRYGTICVNLFTGLAYSQMNTPWGSYPGQDIGDIQSGSGFINNVFMLRRPQKTIFRAPFQRIDPVKVQNRAAGEFLTRYGDFQARPSVATLMRAMLAAMRK